MDMTMESCRSFVEALASNAPAPGGGGAAALVGAMGVALGNMVGALTVGKKKYADVEAEMIALKAECDSVQEALLNQVEADEIGFLPLLKAYGMDRENPHREKALEEAALSACAAPIQIMELCCRAIGCLGKFAEKGSRLAVSDAGCGAVFCKAALQAAALNVFTNTKSMKNRAAAEALNARTRDMLETYCALADEIFDAVKANFIP